MVEYLASLVLAAFPDKDGRVSAPESGGGLRKSKFGALDGLRHEGRARGQFGASYLGDQESRLAFFKNVGQSVGSSKNVIAQLSSQLNIQYF